MSIPGVLSNLAYHPHLAMIVHMRGDVCQCDQKKSKSNCDSFIKASQSISATCERHRDEMEEAARKYWLENLPDLLSRPNVIPRDKLCSAIRKVSRDDAGCTSEQAKKVLGSLSAYLDAGQRDELLRTIEEKCSAGHLFRPLCSVGFGHTDNLAIYSGDDFSQIGWALESPDSPVRQTCAALCPDMSKLVSSGGRSNHFCDLSDILSDATKDEKSGLFKFGYVEERPLIAVTYYRTLGLANLGSGLLFQEALLRAMRESIARTMRTLNRTVQDNHLVKATDISSLRCAFVLPIGWAEVATVILSTNYSLVFTLVDEMSHIRFTDLYKVMKGAYGDRDVLREVVDGFGVHAAFAKMKDCPNRESSQTFVHSPNIDPMHGNHVFRSNVTTLAMDHHTFGLEELDPSICSGRVAADPHFSISPGHMREVREESSLKMGESEAAMYMPEADKTTMWVTAGPYDSSDRALFLPTSMPLMDIPDLVRRVKKLNGRIGEPGTHISTWNIHDLFTELTVPLLPVRHSPASTEDNEAPLSISPLLAQLRHSTFDSKGPLSIPALERALEDARVPMPLRTALLQSFADYAKSMSDPLLFDNVLDVHDLFAAAHRVLTQEMQIKVMDAVDSAGPTPEARESARLSLLGEGGTEEIAALAELLEDALKRRTEVGFRQARQWQEAMDSRGGFSKLISAADVPIKCGLDILRRVMKNQMDEVFHDDNPEEDNSLARARVGGASKISYNTSAVTRRFNLGDPATNFIADLSLSMGHLTRPAFLLAHLHETGHLLNYLIPTRPRRCPALPKIPGARRCEKTCFWDASISEPSEIKSLPQVRFEEVFAEMLAFGLVLGPDKRKSAVAYLRQYLAAYFLDPVSTHSDDEFSLLRLVETLATEFMAIDPFLIAEYADPSSGPYRVSEDNKPDVRSARKRFERLVEQSLPLCFDHRRFWTDDAGARSYILEQFERIYRRSFDKLCCIWKSARIIVREVRKPVTSDGEAGTSPPEDQQADILKAFRQGCKKAKPVVRTLYIDPNWIANLQSKPGELRKHLDVTFVMRHVLGVYIDSVFSLFDTNRECCYLPGYVSPKGTNSLLLDRQANGLACMDFTKREEFLRERLFVLMSLWDLSTAIRARNLVRVIETHNSRRS